ncbi:MAG TPA: TIGR01777 family protein, partial [Armatimonadota bacterium]|nr:TIGR01777 family protein [Armatimonadota bacterium]
MPVFQHRSEIEVPAEELFAWHARPGAFERLVPPWERIRVLEREGGIRDGAHLLMELRKGPVP